MKNYKPVLISLFVIIAIFTFSFKGSRIPQSIDADNGAVLAEHKTESSGQQDIYKTGDTITITASQFQFNPDRITIEKGSKVKIVVKSTDVTHGITIEGYDIQRDLPGNNEITFEFIADKEGTFTYYCSVYCGAGHRNMKGTLLVK